jgi:hypothetical protein
MAKRHDLTPHQKGIVRRYYENRDTLMTQKLSEIVSDLYLCTSEKQATKLWKGARTALHNVHPGKARIDRICDARDLEALAALVGEIF